MRVLKRVLLKFKGKHSFDYFNALGQLLADIEMQNSTKFN